MHWNVRLEAGEPRAVRLARSNGAADVWVDGRRHRAGIRTVGERYEVTVEDRTETMWLVARHGVVHVHAFGRSWRLELVDPAARPEEDEAGDDIATAPMPGMVVSVDVSAGDLVTAGQRLLVIESMKMQNEIVAVRDGTIERVLVEPGDGFDRGAVLVALAADAEDGDA